MLGSKILWSEFKSLSFDSKNVGHENVLIFPGLGGRDKNIDSRVLLASQYSQPVISGFSERICLKKWSGEIVRH